MSSRSFRQFGRGKFSEIGADVFQKLYRGRIGDYLEVEAAGVTNEPTGKLVNSPADGGDAACGQLAGAWLIFAASGKNRRRWPRSGAMVRWREAVR